MMPTSQTEKYLEHLITIYQKRIDDMKYKMFENGTTTPKEFKVMEIQTGLYSIIIKEFEHLKVFGL